MIQVLVTGGNGQLANCIKDVSTIKKGLYFRFVDVDDLDITNEHTVNEFFKKNHFDFCINCAAYTAVDHAEMNKEIAEKINSTGAAILARTCNKNKTILIHISTDFVFDGSQTRLYTEKDTENPISEYGRTKLLGEKAISENLEKHIIIRTSWLYSEHGNNFVKTMLRLGSERETLSVVADQIGSPTYAMDLAQVICDIIVKKTAFGTFHYSNEGVASWYDFAKAVFDISGISVELLPINTEAYPTPAERPRFSVMDKQKIKETFAVKIPYWRDSLELCIKNLQIEK